MIVTSIYLNHTIHTNQSHCHRAPTIPFSLTVFWLLREVLTGPFRDTPTPPCLPSCHETRTSTDVSAPEQLHPLRAVCALDTYFFTGAFALNLNWLGSRRKQAFSERQNLVFLIWLLALNPFILFFLFLFWWCFFCTSDRLRLRD